MSFALGLTGSIGMGKSTTAQMFKEAGCAVWDADAAVHRLYAKGGAGAAAIFARFPKAIVDGEVSRDALKHLIANDKSVLKVLESLIHPLVAEDRARFRSEQSEDILVFDIPLLFETGGHRAMDAVACVTAPREVQRERVMARGTMSREQFEHILSQQMPIEEKIRKSDYIVETTTLAQARAQVKLILSDIRGKLADA